MADPSWAEAFLDRIEAGASQAHALREISVHHSLVLRRRKKDAIFDARVTAALSDDGRRKASGSCGQGGNKPVSPEKIEAFLSFLADSTLTKACEQAGLKINSIYSLRKKDPAFDARVDMIVAARGIATGRGQIVPPSAVRLERTILAIAEGLHVEDALKKHQLSAGVFYRLRKADEALDIKLSALGTERRRERGRLNLRKGSGCRPADWGAAIEQVRLGETLASVFGKPGLPSLGQWQYRRLIDPAFVDLLSSVSTQRRTERDAIRASAAQAARQNPTELFRQALSQNEVWAAVNSAVSRSLPSFVRDDVIGEMVADVIEGALDLGDVKAAAGEYVTDHYRASGSYRERSLDGLMFADGRRTLHDVLSDQCAL